MILLVAGALILGGGGLDSIINPLLLELAAAAMLALLLATSGDVAVERGAAAMMIVLILGLVLVTLQVVPLPAGLWSALPGRTIAAQGYELVGASGRWHSLSLDREATGRSARALLPAAAAFFGVLCLDYRQRYRLILVIVGIAVAAALVGMLQFASGSDALRIYRLTHHGVGVGFFANRNHHADLLLIAALLGAAVLRWDPWRRFGTRGRSAALVLLGLFALGVVTTFSRTGLALLVPVAMLVVLMTVQVRDRRTLAMLVGAGVLAAALIAWMVQSNAVLGGLLTRFGAQSDERFSFWPDVLYAMRLYLPWGSGLGSFDPVFRSVEQLDNVLPAYVVHAHNDYAELALEMGVPGLVLVVAGVIALGMAAFGRGAIARFRGDPVRVAAVLGLLLLLMHSAIDYPLRTLTLSTLFAVLAALLVRPAVALPPVERARA